MEGGGFYPTKDQLTQVPEVASNDKNPPYRHVNEDGTINVFSSNASSIPKIDLHLLLSSSSSTKERKDETGKLKAALSTWGLFQGIGHGIPSAELDEMYSIVRNFFYLPMEEKRKYSRYGDDGTMDDLEGYGTDHIKSGDSILDWTDHLYLLVKPKQQRNLNLWPKDPPHFREILNGYSTQISLVADNILKAMAEAVGLEKNCFINQFGESASVYARMNYYPPYQRPDLVDSIKPHTDGGGITILLPDKEVGGLQVLQNGEWIDVPIIPHALVVNIADQMEIMSNGMFKSPIHRVVKNSACDRISLALFYSPDFNNEIEPAISLIDDPRPRMYKKVKVKDYLDIFARSFAQGKRAIDWAKV